MGRCIMLVMLLCSLTWAGAQPSGSPNPAGRSLAEFGPIGTVEEAAVTLEAAVSEIIGAGGGVLIIPPEAPEGLKIENRWQAERRTSDESPVVTIIDYRRGYTVYHLAPIGKHQDEVWAGMNLERKLNLGDRSLPHCGYHSNLLVGNYVISGASSYMATLTEGVSAGKDVRCYVDNIRGIWVGQNLNITSSPVGYAPPYDRIIVKSIGWDPERKRNYFTCDLEYDHPAAALVYNKHVVNGLQVNGYSNCDNQTPGEIAAVRNNYAVGDSFVISGMFKYMGDVFSGFGDEGGIVFNAETVGELNSFHSTVEAVDWSRDELTYAPGVVNAHTLSNSRPLINLNPDKWITRGTVMVVPPGRSYRGQSYPGVIGGPGNVFNYQGGAILASADCPWDESIIGRFFCITDPSETINPDDTSTAGGYAQLPSRVVRRWYQITDLETTPDGMKRIRILRVRWSAVGAGAPTLFDDENYTWDGHERPLTYAIAPGAWVYDISQGWAPTAVTGGWLGREQPRKLKLAATGDRGGPFDFAPGDEIEQAVGPDPWQPRPLRIRQFDQMPSTMPSASIEVEQLGRVQVPYGIHLSGLGTAREDLTTRKDRKPPFDTLLGMDAMANVGLDFRAETLDSAIVFRQPNGRAQTIRWRNDPVGSSSLSVEPRTGDFVLTGGNVNVSGHGLAGVRGVSATGQPAANLRGIGVAVPAGAAQIPVTFATPEADAEYAVAVTPSWLTPVCVDSKTAQGFTVRFAVPAPEGATVDWVMVR